jgi:large subunit ribosomal protein L20
MTKVKHAVSSRKRRKKTRAAVKGQRGSRKLLRTAKESVRKGLVYNYGARKKKKGDFRALWITRIAAFCKEEGISYSKFIAALKKNKIELNRKMLALLAAEDKAAFKALIKKAVA